MYLELNGVAVVVEDHRLVLGEERLEALVAERMRVRAVGAEDHEVGDVDDTDPECGDLLAEERRGGNDLEGHLHTDTDEDDIRGHALVRGGELPDRRAGDTVL